VQFPRYTTIVPSGAPRASECRFHVYCDITCVLLCIHGDRVVSVCRCIGQTNRVTLRLGCQLQRFPWWINIDWLHPWLVPDSVLRITIDWSSPRLDVNYNGLEVIMHVRIWSKLLKPRRGGSLGVKVGTHVKKRFSKWDPFRVVTWDENGTLFKFWLLKMYPFLRDVWQHFRKCTLFKITFEKSTPF
jgi:hypothetical protein